MKLQKLTGLERGKLEDEYKQLMETIKSLKAILESPKLVDDMIIEDLKYIDNKYGGPRKTELIYSEVSELSLDEEDLIKDEPMVITMTKSGYIKRQSLDIYRTQNRGGKGVTGGKLKEEDVINDLFLTNTKDYLFFISNLGKLRALKVYQIHEGSRTNKGKAIVNYLDLMKNEKIATLISVKEFREDHYLLMITKFGKVKKTPLNDFIHLRKNGVTAIKLLEGDELVSVNLTNGENDIIVVTRKGMAIRFNEKDVRSMGRVAAGVRAITLKEDDYIVNVAVVKDESASLLVSTENGYGKRTKISEYRTQRRGGMGVKTIKITPRTGNVVNINQVKPDEELLLITSSGMVVRCKAKDIRVIGRTTQGVRLIRLKQSDSLVAVENIKPDIE